MKKLAPRSRKVRILATLGPASSSDEMIGRLFLAGADAFRLNMSHGTHDDHSANVARIRALEKEYSRPTTILADLQGPKLRIGTFTEGKIILRPGATFLLDRDRAAGDESRVALPHAEIYAAVQVGHRLLVDDGKLVLRVTGVQENSIETRVEVGGPLSDRKGVNVPDAVLPVTSLTDKDRRDLAFAIQAGADWIALSFVQRPEDLAEARRLMGGYGRLLAKIEKPAAIGRLHEILEMSDAVMVARGDLGVELPPEAVPPLQKQIVEEARRLGRPVVVATQMLESMIKSPTPTRAEVSDVAIMDRIAHSIEHDRGYLERLHFTKTIPDPTTADALAEAAQSITDTVSAKGDRLLHLVAGSTGAPGGARAARMRRSWHSLPRQDTARRMGFIWGVHAVRTKDIGSFEEI